MKHAGLFLGMAFGLGLLGTSAEAGSGRKDLKADAIEALKKAATFYRTKVATHGGYVYYYSEDLQKRWGEGVGTPDQIWTEPPGTPSVGLAYLQAYAATADRYFLDAAKEAGMALVYGQLKSGGWKQSIDFNPNGDKVALYRNGKGKGNNYSSLDDEQSQTCIEFLAKLDRALEFKDEVIHEAILYALDGLLKAQFANGGFPQGWDGPAKPYPVLKASYPKEWPRIWPHEPYHTYYTLNDGLPDSLTDTLLVVIEIYKEERFKEALRRLGDFLILAQMPDPQPAWCQQYNFEMQPVWARKFEPPSIVGLESEESIRALMKIYRFTGDEKYLAPIAKAIPYLKGNRLPDGRMPRFYELETNKPLYMRRPPGVSGSSSKPGYYTFTYEDTDLPSHYGWKQPTRIDELEAEYNALKKGGTASAVPAKIVPDDELEKQVRKILGDLDDQGRWISVYDGSRLRGQPNFANGFRYIGNNVFSAHVNVLSRYVASASR